MGLNFNELMTGGQIPMEQRPAVPPMPTEDEELINPIASGFTDEELLDLWKRIKEESFEGRYIWERQWQRNVWYVLGRQWIEYLNVHGGWRDKRIASWVPRPVVNKCKSGVQAIRAIFTAIKLGVSVRPASPDDNNVTAAAAADELAPVLHEAHNMAHVQNEFDFWLEVCGNAFFHSFVDYDAKHGFITISAEQCLGCGQVTESTELVGAQPMCPSCGGTEFETAMDPETNQPMVTRQLKGMPTTTALSPFEVAFPNNYQRFADLPYVVRLRWRPKSYYEANSRLKPMIDNTKWQKAPKEQSLQMFRQLADQNDLGVTPAYYSSGGTGAGAEEGIAEYEVWMKPTDDYPDGLVFRVMGDESPKIVRLEEDEAIPGPIPYTDAEGQVVFPWAHAGYDHVGGRIWASGCLDPMIHMQDQLNQVHSMMLMIVNRDANPIWMVPKEAGVSKFTGMPGLIVYWNSLTTGGQAKPERIPGTGINGSLFQYTETLERLIEEQMGTFDIVKGQKPVGVEAFSAIQALIEQSQSRFSSVFQARGEAYKDWFKIVIELEREFGPEERIKSSLSAARIWTLKKFQRTQLQGSINVIVESGSTTPKTNLGMRASIQQASSLGMVNLTDPEQQYEGLQVFGLTRMIPALDSQIQRAHQKQQQFEEWVMKKENLIQAMQLADQDFQQWSLQKEQIEASAPIDPLSGQVMADIPPAPSPLVHTPLKLHGWYDPSIHIREFDKWMNSDRMVQLLVQIPPAEGLCEAHRQELELKMFEKAGLGPTGQPLPPQGAGMAMENSNQNSQKNQAGGPGSGQQPV